MARLQGAPLAHTILALALLAADAARAQSPPVAYRRISAGVFVTCAISDAGLLYCWCAAATAAAGGRPPRRPPPPRAAARPPSRREPPRLRALSLSAPARLTPAPRQPDPKTTEQGQQRRRRRRRQHAGDAPRARARGVDRRVEGRLRGRLARVRDDDRPEGCLLGLQRRAAGHRARGPRPGDDAPVPRRRLERGLGGALPRLRDQGRLDRLVLVRSLSAPRSRPARRFRRPESARPVAAPRPRARPPPLSTTTHRPPPPQGQQQERPHGQRDGLRGLGRRPRDRGDGVHAAPRQGRRRVGDDLGQGLAHVRPEDRRLGLLLVRGRACALF
jgi:hypothetical protein